MGNSHAENAADHALGLELQIEELVEQRERARVQGRDADGAVLTDQIADLMVELAAAADDAVQPVRQR